ncbi:MAG: ROK family protein, partial [Luteolibacter sp.]
MTRTLEILPKHRPELDADFLPASLWTREFERLANELGSRTARLALLRPNGHGLSHEITLLPSWPDYHELNLKHLERTLKFLLWSYGGNRCVVAGADDLVPDLQQIYSATGARA